MSNINFITYNSEGRILQSGWCFEDDLGLQESEGRFVMPGVGRDDTHYVLNGEIVPRPANPATLTGLKLTKVPIPSTLTINTTTYEVNDSVVDLSFTYPGTYTIEVDSFPWMKKTFTVAI